jgi:hypothetical protein
MAQYEVRCFNCDVSFPVGTKQCLHCGSKIRTRARATPELGQQLMQGDGMVIGAEAAAAQRAAGSESVAADPEELGPAEGRRSFRFGTGAIWVLVLVGGMLSRMCSE